MKKAYVTEVLVSDSKTIICEVRSSSPQIKLGQILILRKSDFNLEKISKPTNDKGLLVFIILKHDCVYLHVYI